MHPVVVRSLGLAMMGLSLPLLGFAVFFGMKYGNPIGIVLTAFGVGAGGYGLTVVADKRAK